MLFKGRSRDGKKTLRALRDLSNQASGSEDPTEESMAKVIVMEERKRLGINESDLDIKILEDEN
jgi:hypothetical protein